MLLGGILLEIRLYKMIYEKKNNLHSIVKKIHTDLCHFADALTGQKYILMRINRKGRRGKGQGRKGGGTKANENVSLGRRSSEPIQSGKMGHQAT